MHEQQIKDLCKRHQEGMEEYISLLDKLAFHKIQIRELSRKIEATGFKNKLLDEQINILKKDTAQNTKQ